MRTLLLVCGVLLAACAGVSAQPAQPASSAAPVAASVAAPAQVPGAYDIGTPTLRDIWVDAAGGSDTHSGTSRADALQTIMAAWEQIPISATLTTGYRILIAPGTYGSGAIPKFWEYRRGTFAFPIILQPADGAGTVTLAETVQLFASSYVYFVDLRMALPGDVFHCELCDHLLIRGSVLRGSRTAAHETVKINQSQYVYLEGNDISGADDNAVDFVAVQHGHVRGNRIHDSVDWCMYAKGGSAYLQVDANELYDCGTGGFTAGQGTGFQFMTAPWLHYEAYDIKVTNNVIHDTDGAGLGVNGGYNILLAYNTLYHIGLRSHLVEAVFGLRSCDGQPGDPGRERCTQYLAAGGWGTVRVDDGSNAVRIPNRHVWIYNNLIYNPAGVQSGSSHLSIAGPSGGANQSDSNVPVPALADDDLVIRNNIIWNGPANHPLGIEDSAAGCQPSNSTCSAAQLRADNRINQFAPELVNPAAGSFAPTATSNVLTVPPLPIPAFRWADAPSAPPVPAGTLPNSVALDFSGAPRSGRDAVGAFARPASFALLLALMQR